VSAEVPRDDDLLTLRVAGQRFGVSTAVLRRLVARGQLPGAHKRPTQSGEEWVVPAASVAALVLEAHGSQASSGSEAKGTDASPEAIPANEPPAPSPVDEPGVPAGAAAEPTAEPAPAAPVAERHAEAASGRGGRRSMRLPVAVILLGLAIALLIGLTGGRDGDPGAPRSTSSAELAPGDDAARIEVEQALAAELADGEPVGVLGDGAAALLDPARPTVELPLPGAAGTDMVEVEVEVEVVVVAGARSGEEEAAAEALREQGQLILTLASPYPAAEIWRVHATEPPEAPAPTEAPAPPEAPAPTEAPAPPEAPPSADGSPAETPASVVVEAGGSFWTVAVDLAGPGADSQQVHERWVDLIETNRDLLPDPGNPDLVYVGTVLVVP
jgi:nucleoid-associated protein YgaU